MSVAALVSQKPGYFQLSGELSFNSVVSLLQGSQDVLNGPPAVTMDLSAVTHADSAGLALLLEWLRRTRQAGIHLHYVSVPAQLHALATISEVADFLDKGSSN